MSIDAHQHFWRYSPAAYPWIRDAVLKQDYLPEALAPLLAEAGFTGTIAVQARAAVEESVWLLHLSDAYPFIRGVVGWVDLCSEMLREQLRRLCLHSRFRGVRYPLKLAPGAPVRFDDAFLQGLAALTEFDLVYELLGGPELLPAARALAERFPQQRFVLDHIAKPPIRERSLEPWASDLRRLAACPNVSCKLSGMVTEAQREAWRPEDMHPYLEVVLEAFTPQRLMIGSDWPVCLLAGAYGPVMRVVQDYIARLPGAEQDAILGANAERIYQLHP